MGNTMANQLERLPARVIALDVETTGLGSWDRVVSLGAWRLQTDSLSRSPWELRDIHLIFDPKRRCHPNAEAVHGYAQDVLTMQDRFERHAGEIGTFLADADLIIAHNTAFDLHFVDRELRKAGQPPLSVPLYCTMEGFRASGKAGRASLEGVSGLMGLSRAGKRHGALEDAWLALMAYLWLQGEPPSVLMPFAAVLAQGRTGTPTNLRLEPDPDRPPLRRSAYALGAPARIWSTERRRQVLEAARPLAIIVLAIVKADGVVVAEEIDIVASLIKETRDRLGFPPDAGGEAEILATLLDIVPSNNMITRAMKAVLGDPVLVGQVSHWVALAATSDGSVSEQETTVIETIKATVTRLYEGMAKA